MQQHTVCAVGQADFFTVFIFHFSKLDIRIVDHGKNIPELRVHFAAGCQQLFFRRRKYVLLATDQLPQKIVIIFEPFVFAKTFQRFIAQSCQLRLHK